MRSVAVGDEVLGFTHQRASHAEFVVVDDVALTSRPAGLPWDVAGSLYVAGTTAYATVFAVDPGPADTVVVSGAAGGVGSLAVQLARRRGATVIGLASEPILDLLRTPHRSATGTLDQHLVGREFAVPRRTGTPGDAAWRRSGSAGWQLRAGLAGSGWAGPGSGLSWFGCSAVPGPVHGGLGSCEELVHDLGAGGDDGA